MLKTAEIIKDYFITAFFTNIKLIGRFVPIFYFHCEHVLFVCIVKQNKISQIKKNRRFSKFSRIEFCYKHIFENSIIQLTFPGVTWGPTQNLVQIGSAVSTFIGYEQTSKV